MNQEIQEGDVVLCTVDRIVGTAVFVKIDGNNEGSIVVSEIAPGRIRNLRDYVVPKKRIVCKVLRIDDNKNIHLSLRRVTSKEKKEVMEQFQQEQKFASILKSILGEKTNEIIDEIKKKETLNDFLEDAKKDSAKLEKLVGKNESERILNILNTQKKKTAVVKKEFLLKTTKPNGLSLIKDLLSTKEAEIDYISAGRYSIKIESSDLKKADNKINEILKRIEEQSKKQKLDFSLK